MLECRLSLLVHTHSRLLSHAIAHVSTRDTYYAHAHTTRAQSHIRRVADARTRKIEADTKEHSHNNTHNKTHTYKHTYRHTPLHIHTHPHTHTHTYTHTHTHTHTYTHTHTHTHTRAHTRAHAQKHTNTYRPSSSSSLLRRLSWSGGTRVHAMCGVRKASLYLRTHRILKTEILLSPDSTSATNAEDTEAGRSVLCCLDRQIVRSFDRLGRSMKIYRSFDLRDLSTPTRFYDRGLCGRSICAENDLEDSAKNKQE